MASKPRRRRHNKHNNSYVYGTKADGTLEKVPLSRKAFKTIMRDDQAYVSHDLSILKMKTKDFKSGDVVFIKAVEESYELNNKKLAGYYSVNSRGLPVRLTDDQLDTWKQLKELEKNRKLEMQSRLESDYV